MNNPRNLDEFRKWAARNLGSTVFLQYENRKAVNKVVKISGVNSTSLLLEDENGTVTRVPFPKKGHYRFYNDSFRLSTRDFRYDTSGARPRGRGRSTGVAREIIPSANLNAEIEALLSMFPKGHLFTNREKRTLSGYQIPSSSYINIASQVQHSVVAKMWELARQFGIGPGARILDPAAGVGILFSVPDLNGFHLHALEPNPVGARIIKVLSPGVNVLESELSAMILSCLDPKTRKLDGFPGSPFDLVIGIPPTGSWTAVRDLEEVRRTHANGLSDYYMTRSLDLLKPGGLLIQILREEHLSGGKSFLELGNTLFRKGIDNRAELLEAFRFPTLKINNTTTNSDLVVLRKKQ
jgi:hypothetical protein